MCRVLILDDDVFVANSIMSILESNGNFNPTVCLRLEDALRFAREATQAGKPYEILLIDMRLRDEKDGIQAMSELQASSPNAETIIFTGFEDPDEGVLAYKAGAFRYMTKPIQRDELLFVLNSLIQKRRQETEQRWQKVLVDMTEGALHKNNFQAVAKIVLVHALQLGFKRAHLFWVPRKEDAAPHKKSLVGIDCSGAGCIPNFAGKTFRLDDLGSLEEHLKSRNVTIVQPTETRYIFNPAIAQGFPIPHTAWAILPLWRGNELLGCLNLDFGETERNLQPFELDLINFFARQVSVILENSTLHIQTERTLMETEIIGEIGRQISTDSVTLQLPQLLDNIRKHLDQLLDTTNFSVFLYKEEQQELHFDLVHESGVAKKRRHRSLGHGLEEYMLRQKEAVYIPGNVKQFAKNHGIELRGKMPTSWLGAPMQVGGKIIGGIVIQKFSGKKIPSAHKVILAAAANQVAGAIQISRYAREEAQDASRVNLLNEASLELMQLAQKNPWHFWLTVLTLATADFGLGFNRALLFLAQDNQCKLRGEAGIGAEDRLQAIRDWRRDRARNFDFDKFRRTVGTKRMRLTPFHEKVRQIEIAVDHAGLLRDVLNGSLISVSEADAVVSLPAPIRENFSIATCALLPVRAGNRVLGAVIVDNKHNRKPLDDKSLSRLLLLLDNAGLVWEIVQGGEKTKALLDATQTITAQVTHQTLRETLTLICQKARMSSEADWAIIYPIQSGKSRDELEFDLDNFGCDGHLESPLEKLIATQPRVGGISRHILKRGLWVIPDVEKEDKAIGKIQQLSEHHFIREEGVKALIGAAVRDPYNGESLGIFYLDYRKPREFSDIEKYHALSFANLAANAIASLRRLDEQHQRQLLETALKISQTVGANIDLESILANVLEHLKKTFRDTSLCVLLYDKDDHALNFAPATLRYYKVKNAAYEHQLTFPLNQVEKGSIACKVARKALETRKVERDYVQDVTQEPEYLPLNPATRSELCITLMKDDGNLLGVLALERAQTSFEADDIKLVETVAHELGLAITRAQEKEYTLFKSSIAAMTSWASELAHDIKNESAKIRGLAYLLESAAPGHTEVQEYASAIDKSALKLASIGSWADDREQPISLDQALKTLLTELVEESRDLELELELNLPGTSIQANPHELKRVLGHLVRNAARAMVDSQVKKIKVSSRLHPTKAAHAEIIFRDYGPGIDESVRGRILQVPATTKERNKEQGGYGLLFIRQLIEEMNGTIRLLSPNNNEPGAAFSITLPAMNFASAPDVE